jgi:beta-glucosidase
MTITSTAGARGSDPDERARATEEQLTDDERFSLIISLSGATRFTGGVRDKRYPDEVGTGLQVDTPAGGSAVGASWSCGCPPRS